MTAATAGGVTRPPLTVTVQLSDEEQTEKTIKLTYGLFQDLQRQIPDPGALVDTILAEPFTRDYILRRCMTDTKKMVQDPDKELISAEDCLLDDPEQMDKLLKWVVGHMLYFFATSAAGLKQLSEVFANLNEAPSPPSTSGSKD